MVALIGRRPGRSRSGPGEGREATGLGDLPTVRSRRRRCAPRRTARAGPPYPAHGQGKTTAVAAGRPPYPSDGGFTDEVDDSRCLHAAQSFAARAATPGSRRGVLATDHNDPDAAVAGEARRGGPRADRSARAPRPHGRFDRAAGDRRDRRGSSEPPGRPVPDRRGRVVCSGGRDDQLQPSRADRTARAASARRLFAAGDGSGGLTSACPPGSCFVNISGVQRPSRGPTRMYQHRWFRLIHGNGTIATSTTGPTRRHRS